MVIIYTVCSGVSVIMFCALVVHGDDANHLLYKNLANIKKFAKNLNCFAVRETLQKVPLAF